MFCAKYGGDTTLSLDIWIKRCVYDLQTALLRLESSLSRTVIRKAERPWEGGKANAGKGRESVRRGKQSRFDGRKGSVIVKHVRV